MKSVQYQELNLSTVKKDILQYNDIHHIKRHDDFNIKLANHVRHITIAYLKSPQIYQFTIDAIINDQYISPAVISTIKLPMPPINPSVSPI